jgi:hypothetical protein
LSSHPKIDYLEFWSLQSTAREMLGIGSVVEVPRIACVNQERIIILHWQILVDWSDRGVYCVAGNNYVRSRRQQLNWWWSAIRLAYYVGLTGVTRALKRWMSSESASNVEYYQIRWLCFLQKWIYDRRKLGKGIFSYLFWKECIRYWKVMQIDVCRGFPQSLQANGRDNTRLDDERFFPNSFLFIIH